MDHTLFNAKRIFIKHKVNSNKKRNVVKLTAEAKRKNERPSFIHIERIAITSFSAAS